MKCALASPDDPPDVDELNSMLSPNEAVLPSICHCCVGAAFQRMMPPNRFSARLSLASVVVAEACGPVDAATMLTGTLASGAVAGTIGPSELGDASAVGVVAIVEDRTSCIAATVEAVAMPDTR